jgi:hypothetical protein
MRHMFVGRIVSQHVMLFEPVAYAMHLKTLGDLVARSVISPVAAEELATHSTANLALVRLAERARLADGDWPGFRGGMAIRQLPSTGRQVVLTPGIKPTAFDVMTEAVGLLARAELEAFAELGVGALVSTTGERILDDPRDALLVPTAWDIGGTARPEEEQLAAVLSSIPRLWGSQYPDSWQELSAALTPFRVEDVFVAGCVLEIRDRAAGIESAIPTLVRHAHVVADGLTNAMYASAVDLKRSSLLAELLLCWWPRTNRTIHLFTSELDYLTSLPTTPAR